MKYSKMKVIAAACLCLLLPACALAVTEGVVEDAPDVTMERVEATEAPSYLPDASYYADMDWPLAWEHAETWVENRADEEGCYHDTEQRPRLTAGETARCRSLLAAYEAGEAAGDGASVLNAMENVTVGVYALDPEDFAGERAYLLLPGTCLTDGQLLAIIDAYAQLGLTFDPDALSMRNCARGGGIETSRFLSEEELARYGTLAKLIERGLIYPAGMQGEQVVRPKLDSRYFSGLTDFTLRAYRKITDEELCAALAKVGVHDLTGEIDMTAVEKQARDVLCGSLGCPLSMTLESTFHEGNYVPNVFDADGGMDWQGESRRSYGANFTYSTDEGVEVHAMAMFDWETGELADVLIAHQPAWNPVGPSVSRTVTQEEITAAIQETEARLGLPAGLEWCVRMEDEMVIDWGSCLPVRAQVEDSLWLTIYISKDDGQTRGLALEYGTLVDALPGEPEEDSAAGA